MESRPAPQRCPALRSAGQQLAKPRDVSKVLWLQDDLTGVEVDLHHAGELNGLMARDAFDDRTVRFDPDQVEAYVPEPHLVVARGGHPFDVGNADPTRDKDPNRKPVIRRQRLSIHCVHEQRVGLECFGYRLEAEGYYLMT